MVHTNTGRYDLGTGRSNTYTDAGRSDACWYRPDPTLVDMACATFHDIVRYWKITISYRCATGVWSSLYWHFLNVTLKKIFEKDRDIKNDFSETTNKSTFFSFFFIIVWSCGPLTLMPPSSYRRRLCSMVSYLIMFFSCLLTPLNVCQSVSKIPCMLLRYCRS